VFISKQDESGNRIPYRDLVYLTHASCDPNPFTSVRYTNAVIHSIATLHDRIKESKGIHILYGAIVCPHFGKFSISLLVPDVLPNEKSMPWRARTDFRKDHSPIQSGRPNGFFCC
jgi:hypothetical protein